MVFSFSKSTGNSQSLVNVEEAYNLWDLTLVKYQFIDRGQIWLTYAHDPELKMILQKALDKVGEGVKVLEGELKKYSIGGPIQPRASMSSSANTEILLDQDMGGYLLLSLQANVELLFRAFRTSTTNDSIRAIFVKFLKEVIHDLDLLIKYLKLKGWTQIPPMYPNIPIANDEKLDAGEAFHLWDHLTFRYDNINQTQFWYEYAEDIDFKYILKKGLQRTLQKQAIMLEKELDKFGIPLPKRPPAVITASQKNLIDDKSMFRTLYGGIIGAAWLHALALKQCITNDRIRKIFNDLMLEEINILDKMILFGKMKGWFSVVPQYMPKL